MRRIHWCRKIVWGFFSSVQVLTKSGILRYNQVEIVVCNSTPYSRGFCWQDWGEGTKLQSVHHRAILNGLCEWSRQKLSPWWGQWSPPVMCQASGGSEVPLVGRECSVTATETDERREFAACPSPWPASGGVDHRFVGADRVACMNHTLQWKFNLIGSKAKDFKKLYVFLYRGKKFEHTSSPHGERFLFSSCQNTRVIWVFLSSFPDACFELMGLNRSNLLCWHFPPPTAQRVSPCRYIIISFPEEAAALKIERMGWEILGLNQRSNLTGSCKREWGYVDCCLGGRYFLHAYVCR